MLTGHAALTAMGLPGGDAYDLPTSQLRFPDGGHYRVEIPSVEGPEALQAVFDEADKRNVPIHRISQGSGIMMQTDDEILSMLATAKQRGAEVSLFTGPRGSWDVGVQASASAGGVGAGSLRGADQLRFAVEDVMHGCELGLRSVLVSDIGHLMVLGRLKRSGDLPSDLTLKVSIQLPVANPATARLCEELGATTLNLPVDLPLPVISAIRQSVALPVDVYVEAADEFGGTVRHYEIPELVRVAAPIYIKFTLRNAPSLYPSGGHMQEMVIASARERVRRASIGLTMLKRYMPDARPSTLHSPRTRAQVSS